MSGIAPPSARLKVDQKIRRGRNRPGIVTALLAKIVLAMTVASAQTTLPAGLESPDGGVVFNHERAICYDRNGPSIGLTETFLGHIVSDSDDCRPAIRPEHWMMGGPWNCSDVVQKLAHPAAEIDGLIVD
jgi:hypothetical protein